MKAMNLQAIYSHSPEILKIDDQLLKKSHKHTVKEQTVILILKINKVAPYLNPRSRNPRTPVPPSLCAYPMNMELRNP